MVVMILFLVIAVLFLLILFFYKFVFLRDPERKVPLGNNIVSPADGKIIKIVELKQIRRIGIPKGLLGKIRAFVPSNCRDGFIITIMMNIFDVHVQRAPLGGEVLEIKHTPGKFRNAVYGKRFENGWANEKNEITINTSEIGVIKVIQIAGFVARRIICFVKKNDKVNKGGRLGKIVFGSQVCLILPNVRLTVREGARVKAGETILARF